MSSSRILVCCLALALGACGGSVSGSGGAGGTTGTGGSSTGGTTGTGGSSTGGTTATGGTTTTTTTGGPTGCPAVEPSADGACDVAALRCTYGDSPSPSCRRGFLCQGGKWQVDGLGCFPEPPACPAGATDGIECSDQPNRCVTSVQVCVCGPCGGAGCPDPPWFWSCGSIPTMGCPELLPNDGTACDDTSLVCEYGVFCNDEATARCTNGAWKWDPSLACP